jgi:cytochrome c oxidase accessory protein FixG
MALPLKAPRPSLDSVTTIRDDGSRLFLHPSDARGRFTRWRRLSGWLLIGIYLSLPWIPVGGHPAVFLDVAARRFHLFGFTLAFQDAWLLFFLISGLGFALFFVTSLLGRVWCGWACPQTVFLDHVYRRIERWMEGDAPSRRALDAAPWTAMKVARRTLKQVLYVAASAIIAHLFLAYFVSLPELWSMMHEAPGTHWGAFVFVFIFTAVLYFNFAWFREQLCIVICPYGRLQSVLIDDHSLVIGYDVGRGEPRGPRAAGANVNAAGEALGDCVACNRCVQVCPTGIDIRQGLQIECIGCAACIDACDEVMGKVKKPKGLIRYDSLEGLAGRVTRWFRARTVVYAILLLIGSGVATWALSTLRPANVGVTRMAGAPYFVDTGHVRNQFLVRLVNKRDVPVRFTVSLPDSPATMLRTGFEQPVVVGPLGELVSPLVVRLPRTEFNGVFHLDVVVSDEAGTFAIKRGIEFVGPDPALLREEEREWTERMAP